MNNELVRIDTHTADVTPVGPVGFDFGPHGAAWSEQDQLLYLLADDDTLYRIDTQTGMATAVGPLGVELTHIGTEIHPATGKLYGCTSINNLGHLYELDRATGQASLIGPIETGQSCSNLGAPWTGSEVCLPIPG